MLHLAFDARAALSIRRTWVEMENDAKGYQRATPKSAELALTRDETIELLRWLTSNYNNAERSAQEFLGVESARRALLQERRAEVARLERELA